MVSDGYSSHGARPAYLSVAPLAVDLVSGRAWRDDLPLYDGKRLPPTAAGILWLLMSRAPAWVSLDEIRDVLWCDPLLSVLRDGVPKDNTVRKHIETLRRIVDKRGRPLIKNEPGEGWYLAL